MGRIKYPNLDKRLYVFCKARIDFEYNIDKKHYNVKEIDYCFIDMNRPQCLGKVPCIGIFELGDFNKDLIFNTYNKHVPNTVEGMVICFNNSISKIVVNKPDSKKEPMIKQKKDTI